MSITLTNFLTHLNNHIDDNITGTTTSAGNAGGTTLVDTLLYKYPDGYFGDEESRAQWWLYYNSQLRAIKEFHSDTGTITVYTAFSAQVATASAYEIHRLDRDKKVLAANQALVDCFPWFYNVLEDSTTLVGKGSDDNEYSIPATFTEFPSRIIIRDVDSGGTEYDLYDLKDFTPVGDTTSGMKFYADIDEADVIILQGKTYLSQFTTDTTTTELNTTEARVVALLAASILYRRMTNTVNSEDSARYAALADRLQLEYEMNKYKLAMPLRIPRMVRDWS